MWQFFINLWPFYLMLFPHFIISSYKTLSKLLNVELRHNLGVERVRLLMQLGAPIQPLVVLLVGFGVSKRLDVRLYLLVSPLVFDVEECFEACFDIVVAVGELWALERAKWLDQMVSLIEDRAK